MKGKIMKMAFITLLAAGCDKDDEVAPKKKTATELLTQKEWFITGVGFDDNKNGILDPQENTLQDCEEDNTYTFHASGNGSIADNALTCGTPVNNNFQWSFKDNETKLEISMQSSFIQRLTEEEMILNPELPWLNVNFLILYRH